MKKILLTVLAAAFVVMLSGCNEMFNNDQADGKSRLVIRITDDPFDISYIESATVTITKVEIRRTGDGVPDGNPFMVLFDDTVTIDLIDLRNGLTETLIDMEIEDGEYDLVRLYVMEAGLKLKDIEDPYKVKVPSGEQTGIKIFISPALNVSGGLTEELLLDVDLSRSFVLRGNMDHNNGFIFKPVIRAANMTTAGRIEGMVKDTAKVKVKEAKVWITRDTTVATAFADTMGYYAIIGVPAGTYSIFATKEGYDTVKYENISVLAGSKTVRDFILTKK